jgi:hypothetical protein
VARAVASRNSLSSRLASAGPVVFDLRGRSFQISSTRLCSCPETPVHGLSLISRRHEGYASPQFPRNQDHSSSWDFRDAASFDATPGSNHLVFLVNRETTLPLIALAIQDSGAGAIVSEDPISNQQVNLSRSVPVMGKLRAAVLTREIVYRDGTEKFADAENNREYEACVAEMVSHAHDSHAVVSRSGEPWKCMVSRQALKYGGSRISLW